MNEFVKGDRVRVDNGGDHHGQHGTVVALEADNQLEIEFANESKGTYEASVLRPVPNTGSSLSRRERDTLTNIWGDTIPNDLREIDDDELLWDMRRQLTQAVEQSHVDDDMDALGILFPLEYKISEILAERTAID